MKVLAAGLIAVLLGFSIYSSYKYFSSIDERQILLNEVKLAQEQVLSIQRQRDRLITDLEREVIRQKSLAEEKTGLQVLLRSAQNDLLKMQGQLQAAQEALDGLNDQLALARAENSVLNNQVGELKIKADAAVREKESVEAKFNTLSGLRTAIRELKRKLSLPRSKVFRPKIVKFSRSKKDELILGNGGYMIKDGKPTYPARIKIEVVPLFDNP